MRKSSFHLFFVLIIGITINIGGCLNPLNDNETEEPGWIIPALASATADIIHGQAPLTVNFTGTAFRYINFLAVAVDADSYSWDFGDVSTSLLQNPSHEFVSPGLYLVELTVTINGVSGTDLAPVVVYNSIQRTFISGELSENTTWDSSGSPYIITGDFLVPSGKTLNISQDAVVVLASGCFSCEGILVIQGISSKKPVILSILATDEEGLGNKIDLKSGPQTSINYSETYDTLFEVNSNDFSAANNVFYNSPLSLFNSDSILLADNIFQQRKREDKPALKLYACNNITIQNSNISLNAIGISMAECTDILIDNCTLNDNLSHNGMIIGLSDAEIRQCTFNNNNPHALLIIGNIDDPNNPDYAHEVSIHDNTILFNHADSINFEYYYGNIDSTSVSNNEIAYDRMGSGILVEYGAFNGNILIYNNYIHHNGREAAEGHLDGITIEDAGKVTIKNNTVYNNRYIGINLNHGLNVIIESNIISSNNEQGLILQNNSEAWEKNNTFVNNGILVQEGSTLHQDY